MNREEKRPGITDSAARAGARSHFDHLDAERRVVGREKKMGTPPGGTWMLGLFSVFIPSARIRRRAKFKERP